MGKKRIRLKTKNRHAIRQRKRVRKLLADVPRHRYQADWRAFNENKVQQHNAALHSVSADLADHARRMERRLERKRWGLE